jgi:hypothetical protein
LSNWPVIDEPHSGVPQKAVYSQVVISSTTLSTCTPLITGVESGQVHTKPAKDMISSSAGIMFGQFPAGREKATGGDTNPHVGPMFTMPVAVAEQPRAVVQVMVYSQ